MFTSNYNLATYPMLKENVLRFVDDARNKDNYAVTSIEDVLIPKLKMMYIQNTNKVFPNDWSESLELLVKKFKEECPVCLSAKFVQIITYLFP